MMVDAMAYPQQVVLGQGEQYDYPPALPIMEQLRPNEDFFKYMITGNDEIDRMLHSLRGEVQIVKNGAKEYKKVYEAWISDDGIFKILHVMDTCGISKNILLGNLTTDQINYKAQKLKINLSYMIFKEGDRYEVKIGLRTLLVDTVINQIHSGLTRSEGGKMANQLTTASQRQEVYHHAESGKKEGMLSGIGSGIGKLFGKGE